MIRLTEKGKSLCNSAAFDNLDAFDFNDFCEEIYEELQKYENFMEENEFESLEELNSFIKKLEENQKREEKRDKKIFKSELFAYINFFEQKKLQPEALSYELEQINLAVKYSINVLNVLSNRFQKESKSNCDKFLQNIDVMKHDLKDTEFETVYEVLEEILDDLEFLKQYAEVLER